MRHTEGVQHLERGRWRGDGVLVVEEGTDVVVLRLERVRRAGARAEIARNIFGMLSRGLRGGETRRFPFLRVGFEGRVGREWCE